MYHVIQIGLMMWTQNAQLSYISGKITTTPGLFSDLLLQNEHNHQIMNAHTK